MLLVHYLPRGSSVVRGLTCFSSLLPLQPGRVVTLIEDDDVSKTAYFFRFGRNYAGSRTPIKTWLWPPSSFPQARTWGVAFEVTGAQVEESLKYLNVRETVCGGYSTKMVDFHADDGSQPPVQALLYIATADNPLYLGSASPEEIGAQIAVSRGKTGHNLEYLLRLAQFMRSSCPHVDDHHLFAVETAALAVVAHLLGAQ